MGKKEKKDKKKDKKDKEGKKDKKEKEGKKDKKDKKDKEEKKDKKVKEDKKEKKDKKDKEGKKDKKKDKKEEKKEKKDKPEKKEKEKEQVKPEKEVYEEGTSGSQTAIQTNEPKVVEGTGGVPNDWLKRIFFAADNSAFSPGSPDYSAHLAASGPIFGICFLEKCMNEYYSAPDSDSFEFQVIASLCGNEYVNAVSFGQEMALSPVVIIELVPDQLSMESQYDNAQFNTSFCEGLLELSNNVKSEEKAEIKVMGIDGDQKIHLATGGLIVDFSSGDLSEKMDALVKLMGHLKATGDPKKARDDAKETTSSSPVSSGGGKQRCGRDFAREPAFLCSDCGWSSNAENCCVCSKWMGSSKFEAHLCSDCHFGARENCCKCGKWYGSTQIPAHLCSDCGWSSNNEKCSKLK